MARLFTDLERRSRLGLRHGLAPGARFASAGEAAEALVGLHASDPATPYLSARARVAAFDLAELEASLYEHQELIKHLCMRRTLFVLPQTMLHLVQAAVSDDVLVTQRRQLAKAVEERAVAADGEAWLVEVEAAAMAGLRRLGSATGAAWSRSVPELQTKLLYAPGKSYGGEMGVATRVYTILALAGQIRRGRPRGWTSSQHTWELITEPTGVVRSAAEARAELAGRWLRSFGPAPVSDVVWWTGLGVTKVRPALAACGAVTVTLADGSAAVALPDDLDPVEPCDPWVAVLPGLDATAMGWKARDWYLDPAYVPLVFDRNGNVGPTLWADGAIVGGWAQRKDGELRWRILADIGAEATAALEAELAALQAWLGSTVVTVRFPAPVDTELRA